MKQKKPGTGKSAQVDSVTGARPKRNASAMENKLLPEIGLLMEALLLHLRDHHQLDTCFFVAQRGNDAVRFGWMAPDGAADAAALLQGVATELLNMEVEEADRAGRH